METAILFTNTDGHNVHVNAMKSKLNEMIEYTNNIFDKKSLIITREFEGMKKEYQSQILKLNEFYSSQVNSMASRANFVEKSASNEIFTKSESKSPASHPKYSYKFTNNNKILGIKDKIVTHVSSLSPIGKKQNSKINFVSFSKEINNNHKNNKDLMNKSGISIASTTINNTYLQPKNMINSDKEKERIISSLIHDTQSKSPIGKNLSKMKEDKSIKSLPASVTIGNYKEKITNKEIKSQIIRNGNLLYKSSKKEKIYSESDLEEFGNERKDDRKLSIMEIQSVFLNFNDNTENKTENLKEEEVEIIKENKIKKDEKKIQSDFKYIKSKGVINKYSIAFITLAASQ